MTKLISIALTAFVTAALVQADACRRCDQQGVDCAPLTNPLEFNMVPGKDYQYKTDKLPHGSLTATFYAARGKGSKSVSIDNTSGASLKVEIKLGDDTTQSYRMSPYTQCDGESGLDGTKNNRVQDMNLWNVDLS